MASFFSPPVRLIGATTLARPHPGNQLMRHYVPNRVGVNVYLMPGGVLTEIDPYSDLDAVRVFHGGHIHPVSDAEVALLVAAGYGDNILTAGIPGEVADIYTDLYSDSYGSATADVSAGIDVGTPDEGGAVYPGVMGDVYADSYLDSYGAPGGTADTFTASYQETYT